MNRSTCSAAGALSLLFLSTAPAHAATLVAHFTGDGTTADASGNGHTGTLQNAGYASGVFGQAFAFTGVNSAFVVNNAADLNFGVADFSYTLRFQVPTGGLVNNNSGFISKDDFPLGSPTKGWLANVCASCGGVGTEIRNGAVDQNQRTNAAFLANQWYSLTFVRSSNVNSLYLNGSFVTSTVGTINVSNSAPVTIGALNAVYNGSSFNVMQSFEGLIDDVAIYSGALTASEVASISANGVAPAVPEPGTWSMMIVGFGLVGGAVRRGGSVRGNLGLLS